MKDYHVYVHIPYCKGRCPYCYFTAKFDKREMCNLKNLEPYVNSLVQDIQLTSFPNENIKTLVFGGGTPSLLDSKNLKKILNAIKNKVGEEIYSNMDFKAYEVSPDTATEETLLLFRKEGFNRISIGVQSFIDDELKNLGRPYGVKEIDIALKNIQKCNYDLMNIDLLVGVPGQSKASVLESVKQAITYKPEHISISLFYEGYPGGRNFVERCIKNGHKEFSYQEKIDMYTDVCNYLIDEGYIRLDNTVFSLPDYIFSYEKDAICETKPLLAFGPGSAGYWKGKVRYTPPYIDRYIEKPLAETKDITIEDNSFAIIWGHLNAYGYIDIKTVNKFFGTDFKTIMSIDKDVNQLITTLCNDNIVKYEDNIYYEIKKECVDKAILVMHYIRDGWGYKLDTAPKEIQIEGEAIYE